jgi:hypothetical protein
MMDEWHTADIVASYLGIGLAHVLQLLLAAAVEVARFEVRAEDRGLCATQPDLDVILGSEERPERDAPRTLKFLPVVVVVEAKRDLTAPRRRRAEERTFRRAPARVSFMITNEKKSSHLVHVPLSRGTLIYTSI